MDNQDECMTYLLHELGVTTNHSCYNISMSIQVFGGTLYHNVYAQICRPVSMTAASRVGTQMMCLDMFCIWTFLCVHDASARVS